MPDHFVVLLFIGLAAGVLAGMFGIGGGVVIVPALITLLAFEPIEAISTSLAALLLPVGVFAVLAYHRAGLLEIRSSALVAAGLVTTTYLGAQVALNLPADRLRQLYGLFLIYMSWRFIEPRRLYQARLAAEGSVIQGKAASIDGSQALPAPPDVAWYIVLSVGLIAGVMAGLFGIGGGIVIVPALVGILRYDQKLAVGTSLGALLLPVGLPGVLAYYQAGTLDVPAAIPVAAGLALGALGGARITLSLSSQTVKRLYGLFILVVGIRFILGL